MHLKDGHGELKDVFGDDEVDELTQAATSRTPPADGTGGPPPPAHSYQEYNQYLGDVHRANRAYRSQHPMPVPKPEGADSPWKKLGAEPGPKIHGMGDLKRSDDGSDGDEGGNRNICLASEHGTFTKTTTTTTTGPSPRNAATKTLTPQPGPDPLAALKDLVASNFHEHVPELLAFVEQALWENGGDVDGAFADVEAYAEELGGKGEEDAPERDDELPSAAPSDEEEMEDDEEEELQRKPAARPRADKIICMDSSDVNVTELSDEELMAYLRDARSRGLEKALDKLETEAKDRQLLGQPEKKRKAEDDGGLQAAIAASLADMGGHNVGSTSTTTTSTSTTSNSNSNSNSSGLGADPFAEGEKEKDEEEKSQGKPVVPPRADKIIRMYRSDVNVTELSDEELMAYLREARSQGLEKALDKLEAEANDRQLVGQPDKKRMVQEDDDLQAAIEASLRDHGGHALGSTSTTSTTTTTSSSSVFGADDDDGALDDGGLEAAIRAWLSDRSGGPDSTTIASPDEDDAETQAAIAASLNDQGIAPGSTTSNAPNPSGADPHATLQDLVASNFHENVPQLFAFVDQALWENGGDVDGAFADVKEYAEELVAEGQEEDAPSLDDELPLVDLDEDQEEEEQELEDDEEPLTDLRYDRDGDVEMQDSPEMQAAIAASLEPDEQEEEKEGPELDDSLPVMDMSQTEEEEEEHGADDDDAAFQAMLADQEAFEAEELEYYAQIAADMDASANQVPVVPPKTSASKKRKFPVFQGYEWRTDKTDANSMDRRTRLKVAKRFFGADVYDRKGAPSSEKAKAEKEKKGEPFKYQKLAADQEKYFSDFVAHKTDKTKPAPTVPDATGLPGRTRIKARNKRTFDKLNPGYDPKSGAPITTPNDLTTETSKKLREPTWERLKSGTNEIQNNMNPSAGNVHNFGNQGFGDYGHAPKGKKKKAALDVTQETGLSHSELAKLVKKHLTTGQPFKAADFPGAADPAGVAQRLTNLIETSLGEIKRYLTRGTTRQKGKPPVKNEELPVGSELATGLQALENKTPGVTTNDIWGAGDQLFGPVNAKKIASKPDVIKSNEDKEYEWEREHVRKKIKADPALKKEAEQLGIDVEKHVPRVLQQTEKEKLRDVYGDDSDTDGEDYVTDESQSQGSNPPSPSNPGGT